MSHGRIMEEREAEMISPTGGGGSNRAATFRLGRFLSPLVTSDDEVPSTTFSSDNLNLNYIKNESLKVNFTGWRSPLENWNIWSDSMHSKYHSLWKQAGICDAIMNSTHKIPRNDELIYGFAEIWCPDTNTFMFPWGEATLTLEDMMIIGGYSVLGDPVFSPIESPELEEVEMKLLSARSELSQTAAKKASQNCWLQKFMNSGSEIEHEAFLSLWLSRFVFPTKTLDDTIGKHVLGTALHLARGTKIALAPAVLASLYANLSEMKRALVSSSNKRKNKKKNKKDEILEISISAPFQLVQIWVWERFSSLRPEPLPFEDDKTRFPKWNNLRMKNTGDVKLAIDKAADIFLWRPYAVGCKSPFPHGIFKEEARWITAGSSIDEEREILVRWLRVSELVGIDSDCIEQYLPHRVAMQFGFDQDVPGPVAWVNSSQVVAWENYNRETRDGRLYVPSCLSESNVTTRYLEWSMNRGSVSSGDPIKPNALRINYKSKVSRKEKLLSSLLEKLPSKRKKISKFKVSSNKRQTISKCTKSSCEKNLKDDDVFSSGFSPRSNHNELTLSSLLEKLAHQRKKAPKLEKPSNKRQKVSKHFKSSEKNSKDDAVVSSDFSPRQKVSKHFKSSSEKNSKDDAVDSSDFSPRPKVSKHFKSSSEKNSKDDAVVSSDFSPMSNDDEMLLSYALEKLCNKRKKISIIETSSNKSPNISKHFENSSEKNSRGFSPKSNDEEMLHSQDTDEQHQLELPRNASGWKDRALNTNTINSTDYKKAFANQKRTNCMEEEVESENGSSKDRDLEDGRAKEMVGSTVFLSTSENNLNVDNAVVHADSHNHEEMPHSEDNDALGMKDEGSNTIKLTGMEHENARKADQTIPNSKQKTEESEKGSSKTRSDEDNQETEADCNEDFNLNTINGGKSKLDAIEEIAIQWDTRLKNLEKIVADLKIKYGSARNDKEV